MTESSGALLEGVVYRLVLHERVLVRLEDGTEHVDRGLLDAYDAANEPGRGHVVGRDQDNSSDGGPT
jgi:co-chaperonin GroES (HSP10)